MCVFFRQICFLFFIIISNALSGFTQSGSGIILKAPYIQFGSGGGFSNMSNDYILTSEGKLYRHQEKISGEKSDSLLKKVSKGLTKDIFTYVEKQQLNTLKFNQPFNMFSYITIHSVHTINTITWGNPSDKTPQSVITLNAKLRSLLVN
jgi:hypothetical protein